MTEGRAWFEMATLATLQGQTAAASTPYRRARAIFQSLDAQPWLARVRVALGEIA